jgi:hypothetical protein
MTFQEPPNIVLQPPDAAKGTKVVRAVTFAAPRLSTRSLGRKGGGMRTGALVAVLVALSTVIRATADQTPAMGGTPIPPTPRAPSPAETTVVRRNDPWVEYARAPKKLQDKQLALVRHLLDAKLQLVDKVGDMPQPYAVALKAAIRNDLVASGNEKMNFGCVAERGVPSNRLMLCAYDRQRGLLLVQCGGLNPRAWLKLYAASGASGANLKEQAVYVFTHAFTRTASSEVLEELNAVVGRPDEVYAVLRRYLAAHPESSFLNEEQ